MLPVYLRFPDKETAVSVIGEEPDFDVAFIGLLSVPTGEVVEVEGDYHEVHELLPGYHVNVLLPGIIPPPEWDDYIVQPSPAVVKWAI